MALASRWLSPLPWRSGFGGWVRVGSGLADPDPGDWFGRFVVSLGGSSLLLGFSLISFEVVAGRSARATKRIQLGDPSKGSRSVGKPDRSALLPPRLATDADCERALTDTTTRRREIGS